jgi:alpha-tubulin suppressor-like RCC1 family protein
VNREARGDVYTWGCGDSGRTGTGGVENVLVPVCLSTFNQIEIVEVSAGPDHVAAVSSSGKLFTWGYGSNGRLGHGDEADVPIPTEVGALSDEKIVHVSCGGHHTAAVTDNGLLYTFGWNHYGQLGHGSVSLNDCTPIPMIVEALKSNVVLQVSCGEQHTIALVQ